MANKHFRTRIPDENGLLRCSVCLMDLTVDNFGLGTPYVDGTPRYKHYCALCENQKRAEHRMSQNINIIHKEAVEKAAVRLVKQDPDAIKVLSRAFPTIMDRLIREERQRGLRRRERRSEMARKAWRARQDAIESR